MTQPYRYTLTNESLVVIADGKPITINKTAPNFKALKDALINERWDDVPANLTIERAVSTWGNGRFTMQDGKAFIDRTEELPANLTRRIIDMVRKGEDPSYVFNFWTRLKKNPSYRSVHQLWDFLQHQNIPFAPDGCFFAYKSVRSDYRDHHSGNFDNSPGKTLKMPRNAISDDPDVACHEGFHVGAYSYASTFGSGGRVVIVKVDPEHVVCVPKDESWKKMRVCEYFVYGNYGTELPSLTFDDTQERTEAAALEVEEDGDEDGEDLDTSALSPAQTTSPVDAASAAKPKKDKKDEEKPARKPKKGFAKFEKMGMAELQSCSIEELRQYAGKGLDIIGASKIAGGKHALVAVIIKTRDGGGVK